MSKKTAIATLLVGSEFQHRWEIQCSDNWRQYSKTFGHDLILVNEPLDRSSRAQSRSPSWQKCLLFEQERFQKYDQVAWIDSDVLFNMAEPKDIIAGVPEVKVGAVDAYGDPTPELNAKALERLWKLVSRNSDSRPPSGYHNCPQDVYRLYGGEIQPLARMMNAGIFVASPRHHASVFTHVYDNYEDRGNPSYYENVPLSYELVKRDLVHWLDPKFNHLWAWSKLLHYPFFQDWRPRSFKDKILRRIAKWSGNDYEQRMAVACATASLLNCHCLHFAGCASEMEFVDLEGVAEGKVRNLGVR
jgi:hypothetical protein